MRLILDYIPIMLYSLLFLGLKVSERFMLTRPESRIHKGWGDWSAWFIILPLWVVLIGPVVEFFVLGNRPELWEMLFGGFLFVGAGFLSIKGYQDLQHGFTQAVESEEEGLVVTGLYRTIRHPISLGNILFCIACPLFLAAGPSWIAALAGVLGTILRISIEESYLQAHIPDYAAYKKRTWAMIPYIY
jgi:protein-S-isoprenylcysteine O-methyltransferase Ste14